MSDERPNCLRCRHYYVTWDERNPCGCRAFGFKTSQVPSAVVRRESGAECQMYEPKFVPPGPRRPGPRDGLYG